MEFFFLFSVERLRIVMNARVYSNSSSSSCCCSFVYILHISVVVAEVAMAIEKTMLEHYLKKKKFLNNSCDAKIRINITVSSNYCLFLHFVLVEVLKEIKVKILKENVLLL